MKKKLHFNSFQKLINWVLVVAILLGTALFLSLLYYREVSYSTLQYTHPTSEIQFSEDTELIAGKKIQGQLIAYDNNLGALGIKITTFNRLNKTYIVFRLREKGEENWYCYNTYLTDRFPNDELYPFGFPVIKDSKGKTYEFEILSEDGTHGNAIGFQKNARVFVSRYTFDKSQILSSNSETFSFILKKGTNLITNINYLFYLAIFIVPLGAFAFMVLGLKNLNKTEYGFMYPYVFIFCMIIVYILYPVLMKTDVVLFIGSLTLALSILYKISFRNIFAIAMMLLLFCPVWFLINKEEMANRSAVLVFFLMAIGLMLLVKELHESKTIKQ